MSLEQKIRQLVEIDEIPKDLPLPVKYDGMAYYWGKNGEMVADFDEGVDVIDGEGFRIRGWGRIKDEKSQDDCAKYIERAINAYSKIQLHHVLQALYGKEKDNNVERSYVAGVHGTTLIFSLHEPGVHEYEWDLTKDLSGQSEETIKFLEEILCH